jgi:N-acyl-D-amino-acid deacylase
MPVVLKIILNRVGLVLLAAVLATIVWILFLRVFDVNPLVGKNPWDVLAYLFSDDDAAANRAQIGDLLGVTIRDFGIGYLVGLAVAFFLAVVFSLSVTLENIFMPTATVLRSIPVIVITPLITLLFGVGVGGVTAIVTLVVFLPALANVLFGLRAAQTQHLGAVVDHRRDDRRMARHWRGPRRLHLPFRGQLRLRRDVDVRRHHHRVHHARLHGRQHPRRPRAATLRRSPVTGATLPDRATEPRSALADSSPAFDLLIRGGTVYDGLGSPGVVADVAIRGDRVVAIGVDLADAGATAARVIDARDLAVAPGFIDPHTHSDVVPLMAEPQPFKLYQGVTTEIVGNCGNSAAPLVDEETVAIHRPISSTEKAGVASRPRTFGQYLDEIEAAGPTNHIASLVGHHTLRMSANGMDVELAGGAVERMAQLADEAFADGAIGFSTGLIYAPGSYAGVDEVTAIARVASRWQRPYATHMRDEGSRLAEGMAEALEVARRSRVRLQVSHCKVAGLQNHGTSEVLLETLRAARAVGVDVLGDQYPYTTGETFLAALLPSAIQGGGAGRMRERLADPAERERWHRLAVEAATPTEGGSPGSWHQTTPAGVMVSMHSDPALQGRTLAQIAADRGVSDWDALAETVSADPSSMMVYELMAEDDVRRILADPLIVIGSDNSIPVGLAHQRAWGCFPTVLGKYTRDLGILTVPEAVRKMTSATAAQFGLVGRGVLDIGAIADIAVFDPATVGHPDGSAATPSAKPIGIPYVVLAGHVVIDGGRFTGQRLGRVLRAGHPEPAGHRG